MTIVGTRPEVIRLACVIPLLDASLEAHYLVHTGQNYDASLSGIFFEEMGIRSPDRHFGIDTSSLGRAIGETLIRTEEAIAEFRPDAVLVLGDTNSALSLVIAKRLGVPTYHMEAGNRCFDENVPEETNRRIVDHASDFNLAYTEHARRNLLDEGIHPRRIHVTGSPMREVLEAFRARIAESEVLVRSGFSEGGFVLVSAHRQENVDSPERLRRLLECIVGVRDRFALPILMSTHPRTRARLEAIGVRELDGVHFSNPFGFLDYNRLQTAAACVLSDSGTIAEEASILGFPAVTLRSSIERPEALDTGAITMADLDVSAVLEAIGWATAPDRVTRLKCDELTPADYRIPDTSSRVLNVILSTWHQHRQWSGLR
jgi:UDP-N-acetylglucosamine 2-epimerase (non-hydrolysing)